MSFGGSEPGDAAGTFWLVVKAPMVQPHRTESAALASAQLLAEQGIRVYVCAPLYDVRPSSTVVPCA